MKMDDFSSQKSQASLQLLDNKGMDESLVDGDSLSRVKH